MHHENIFFYQDPALNNKRFNYFQKFWRSSIKRVKFIENSSIPPPPLIRILFLIVNDYKHSTYIRVHMTDMGLKDIGVECDTEFWWKSRGKRRSYALNFPYFRVVNSNLNFFLFQTLTKSFSKMTDADLESLNLFINYQYLIVKNLGNL